MCIRHEGVSGIRTLKHLIGQGKRNIPLSKLPKGHGMYVPIPRKKVWKPLLHRTHLQEACHENVPDKHL